MTTPVRDRYHAPIPVRAALALILGPSTCVTCLEPVDSPIHRELCEVNGG